MDKHDFFLTMTILGTVFLSAALYIGVTVTPKQAKEMKEQGTSHSLNGKQNLAINLAVLSFYGAIALAAFEVAKGLVKWLVS